MKKVSLLVPALCFILTGCSVTTPVGKVDISEDGSATYTDTNGKVKELSFSNTKAYVDDMLDNVAVPNGKKGELKKYVYDNLDSLGIDLDKIDLKDAKAVDEAEEAIKQALEDKNIDTSDMDIDITKFVNKAGGKDK